MLLLTAGALAACTGNLSIEDMGGYAQTATDLAVPVAAGLGGTVFAVALLLVVVGHVRVWLVGAMRSYWLYRRRWAVVLEDLELTQAKGEQTRVPRLVSVQRHGEQDAVTVRMLPGQSAVLWHERAAALAEEFGAGWARVSFGKTHREIVVVFDRRRTPWHEQLALPARQPHPLPLSMPSEQHEHRAGPQMAMRMSGVQVRIVWARAWRTGENGRMVRIVHGGRFGRWGDMRWCASWATTN
jgi:hypothetical protein